MSLSLRDDDTYPVRTCDDDLLTRLRRCLLALAVGAFVAGCSGNASTPTPVATASPAAVVSPTIPGATPPPQPSPVRPSLPPQSPRDGPWNRDVLSYRSSDGVTFKEPVTVVERAGVPNVIVDHSGRLVAVFQWFPFTQRAAFDRVAVAVSSDGGRSWTAPAPMDIAGIPADLQRPFDPTIVQLPDGRYRLYFTSGVASGTGQGNVGIYSAISVDAIRFQFEPGPRFAPSGGTVDASVVLFRGAWHLFSHNQRANSGQGYHATSQDGLAFTQQPDVNVGQGRQWIGNALVDGETLRYYGSGMGGVWSAVSRDGVEWTVDPGVRVDGGDASVVILENGERILLAVGPLRADAGPSPF